MQKKKACLNCDRNPDLVGQLKATASFKMLFGEEDLNMTQQFDLIRARESPEGWKVASNNRPPGRWNGFACRCWRRRVFENPKVMPRSLTR